MGREIKPTRPLPRPTTPPTGDSASGERKSDRDHDYLNDTWDTWTGKSVGMTDVVPAGSDREHDDLNDAWAAKSAGMIDVTPADSDRKPDMFKDLYDISWLLADLCQKNRIPNAFSRYWDLLVKIRTGQRVWTTDSVPPWCLATHVQILFYQLAKAPLTDAQKQKAHSIRKSGACLRCIVYNCKQTGDRETPCGSCRQPLRRWALGCVRSWDEGLIESVLESIKASRSVKQPNPKLSDIDPFSPRAQLDKRLSKMWPRETSPERSWDIGSNVQYPFSELLRPTVITHKEPQNELIARNTPSSDRCSGADSVGSQNVRFAAAASHADRTIADLGERVRALEAQLGTRLDGSVETSLPEIDAITVQSYKTAESFTAWRRDSRADAQHTKFELSEASDPGTALYHSLASQIANSLRSRWFGRRNMPFAAAPDSESPGDVSSDSETSSSCCDLGSTDEGSADLDVFLSPQVQIRPEQLRHLLLQCNKEGDDKSSQGDPTSSTHSSDLPACSQTSHTLENTRSRRKRGREGDKDGEDDEDHLNKRPQVSNEVEDEDEFRLLRCPYAAFDRHRYSSLNLEERRYHRCSTVILTNIARLK